MAKKISLLFVTPEAMPFAATGGLGIVSGSLPKAIMQLSKVFEVGVILPLHGMVSESARQEMEFLGQKEIQLAWRSQYCGVFKMTRDNVHYYFIDNEYYFKRDGLYGFYDDGERFAFFCKAVIETFDITGFYPTILHANDWQTALIPIYLKRKYYDDRRLIQTVFTIHNIEYQGKFGMEALYDVFDLGEEARATVEFDGCINLMKGAIECCDKLTTVSPGYAQELKYAYFANGLENIIRNNAYKMIGILNGIDLEVYNPLRDEAIPVQYSRQSIRRKAENKQILQKSLDLPQRDEIPLIAIISRLVAHKGMELIERVGEELLQNDIQLVVLGKGDKRFENYFHWLAFQYPHKASALTTYDDALARRIYAAADMLLMPSKSEPCGLSQMIGLRYGTVPIVMKVGGLGDTIRDVDYHEDGNGFVFDHFNAHDMLFAVQRAIEHYNHREQWNGFIQRIMGTEYGWKQSARKYIAMYKKMKDDRVIA
ncbi:MAG: glycogen synthase [Eubacteriales bacterium]|jgi:starch synthase